MANYLHRGENPAERPGGRPAAFPRSPISSRPRLRFVIDLAFTLAFGGLFLRLGGPRSAAVGVGLGVLFGSMGWSVHRPAADALARLSRRLLSPRRAP